MEWDMLMALYGLREREARHDTTCEAGGGGRHATTLAARGLGW